MFFAPLPPVDAQIPATALVLFAVFATFGASTYRHPASRLGKIPVVAVLKSAAPWSIALVGVHAVWVSIRAAPLAGRGGFRGDEPWPREVWLALPAMLLAFVALAFAILSSIDRAQLTTSGGR